MRVSESFFAALAAELERHGVEDAGGWLSHVEDSPLTEVLACAAQAAALPESGIGDLEAEMGCEAYSVAEASKS